MKHTQETLNLEKENTLKKIALLKYKGINFKDEKQYDEHMLELVLVSNNETFLYDEEEYIILNDTEADIRVQNILDKELCEYVSMYIPKIIYHYFNAELWMNDAKENGRGCVLSTYDYTETEIYVNNCDYYVYRIK